MKIKLAKVVIKQARKVIQDLIKQAQETKEEEIVLTPDEERSYKLLKTLDKEAFSAGKIVLIEGRDDVEIKQLQNILEAIRDQPGNTYTIKQEKMFAKSLLGEPIEREWKKKPTKYAATQDELEEAINSFVEQGYKSKKQVLPRIADYFGSEWSEITPEQFEEAYNKIIEKHSEEQEGIEEKEFFNLPKSWKREMPGGLITYVLSYAQLSKIGAIFRNISKRKEYALRRQEKQPKLKYKIDWLKSLKDKGKKQEKPLIEEEIEELKDLEDIE